MATVGALGSQETLCLVESRLPNFSPHFLPYFSLISTSTNFPYSSNFLPFSTTLRTRVTTSNSMFSLAIYCVISRCSNPTSILCILYALALNSLEVSCCRSVIIIVMIISLKKFLPIIKVSKIFIYSKRIKIIYCTINQIAKLCITSPLTYL